MFEREDLDLHGKASPVYAVVLSLLVSSVSLPITPGIAQDISAVGGWTETIDSADLASGPGSDLANTYESVSGASTLAVTYSGSWKVDISKTDTWWSPDLSLYVIRTSDGSGSGSVSGGLSYLEVSTVETEFITGTEDRTGLDVKYRLTGMSVGISPSTYSTSVTFTVLAN
jgi:hypothetical protein